jgi:hypothetical protein
MSEEMWAKTIAWLKAWNNNVPPPSDVSDWLPKDREGALWADARLAECAEREGRMREALKKIHELTVMQSSSACRDIHAVADAALALLEGRKG